MTENGVVPGGEGGGRNVMVGVKFDESRNELLDWALVKVAEPGDTVIALHILGNGNTFLFPWVFESEINEKTTVFVSGFFMFTLSIWICVEIVDRADNSSLISLVKDFDSVLQVYEGFCRLKQVNIKVMLFFSSSLL